MPYDRLLKEADQHRIHTYEKRMPTRLRGLYKDGVICINRDGTSIEKACTLAEEIGHHLTTVGDILDQSKLDNRRQERRARIWAHEKLVPLRRIVGAYHAGIHNRHELAEWLQVTEQFLDEALQRYREKYGLFVRVGKHTVTLDPLGVLESFE